MSELHSLARLQNGVFARGDLGTWPDAHWAPLLIVANYAAKAFLRKGREGQRMPMKLTLDAYAAEIWRPRWLPDRKLSESKRQVDQGRWQQKVCTPHCWSPGQ